MAALHPVTDPGDTLDPADLHPVDDDTAEHVRAADVWALLSDLSTRLSAVERLVGPHAQRSRDRREAAVLAGAFGGAGCLGLGAASVAQVDAGTLAGMTAIVLTLVVGTLVVLGRVSLSAHVPGGGVSANGDSTGSTP